MELHEKIKRIKNFLSHGSGIDADWKVEYKKKYWRCENSFHTMDENGFYDSWADFYITIPKKNPTDFKLHFIGKLAQKLNKKYFLRDYLEQTLYYNIDFNEDIYK